MTIHMTARLTTWLCFVTFTAVTPAHAEQNLDRSRLIDAIVKSPVTPDGTTAGSRTDFVINLNTSMDPTVSGRALQAGKTIKITLPRAFKETQGLPFLSVGEDPNCVPGNLQCNTAVLLQGWPQHPIRPPFQKYTISYDRDSNAIVYTALQDLTPEPPLEPGIKQMHLILLGFTNPRHGIYRVKVEAETGPGGDVERGWAKLRILRKPRASINVTSAFNPGTPNTIYQNAKVGEPVPLPYDFLLWDRRGEPFVGVELVDLGVEHVYLLKQRRKIIGHVLIRSPRGAKGYNLTNDAPSELTNTPVTNVPTARWTTQFTAGSAPGMYILRFRVRGAKPIDMFIDVSAW